VVVQLPDPHFRQENITNGEKGGDSEDPNLIDLVCCFWWWSREDYPTYSCCFCCHQTKNLNTFCGWALSEDKREKQGMQTQKRVGDKPFFFQTHL